MQYQRLMHAFLAIAIVASILATTSTPVPVSADHCGDLEQLVAQLTAETEALAEELRRAETDLDRKTRTLINFLESWTSRAAYLQEGSLAADARFEVIHHVAEGFTIGLIPGILVSIIAPTYVPANVVTILNIASGAHTAYQFFQAWQEMAGIVGEINAAAGGSAAFDDARAYAEQNNLQKLKSLIDLVSGLADLSSIEQVYDDWLNAGVNVESLAGKLDYERAILQLAADELDRCVQEDLSPAGLWMNEDGHVVEIVIEAGSGVVSAVYLTNVDASCPHGDRRPEYLQGNLSGDSWEGIMWRCTGSEELVFACGLTSVWSTSFKATVSSSTISGAYRTEWYAYEYDEDDPGGCHWVRDSSGDRDQEFSMNRVSYPSEESGP